MAKRRNVNALGAVGGGVGLVLGGVGLAVLLGVAANELGEARRRQRDEQERVRRAMRFVLGAVGEVARLFGDGTWMPEVAFDAGCDNASWDGQRICVNLRWAMEMLTASCTDGICVRNRVVFLVAHEIGHALDPLRLSGHRWRDEFEADRIAGWALGRLGIHPQDVVDEVIGWQATATHPGGRERVLWILEGHRQATGTALTLQVA